MLRLVCRAPEKVAWEKPEDMPEALWRLLGARGIQSAEDARVFLHPDEAQIHDPMRLCGMEAAVARILRAKDAGESVCVWGDYDVDGVSATAILTGVLREMDVDVSWYLPSRHGDGYGLNARGIDQVLPSGGLLVTVDCGVSAVEMIRRAKARGLDVIVTDHHRPGDALPDCIVVNPLLGDYPNRDLCGAGVAFQLAMALCRDRAICYVDLAALATVADVVRLAGENRALVTLGLARMNAAPRPGIEALVQVCAIKGPVRAGNLGFQLGPRLNAGGRVGSAQEALSLLQAKTLAEALPLAEALDAQNEARRRIEEEIIQGAVAQLEGYDFASGRVIVLCGPWNVGVVGLSASRIVERYNLPVALLSDDGEGTLTGSCRSIPGVDIFEALLAVSDLLVRFGGHKQAAGLTMKKEDLPAFSARLNAWICASTSPEAFIPRAEYDAQVALRDVDEALVAALEGMQPCGFGNPAPVLMVAGEVVAARAVGREGAHLALTMADGGGERRGIWFSQGSRAGDILGRRQLALFVPRIDAYMNRVSVQLEVKAMRPDRMRENLRIDPCDEEALLHRFLTQRLYNIEAGQAITEQGAKRWTLEELKGRLRADVRGTLIVAANGEGARALLDALEREYLGDALDVYAGTYPSDPRTWNALCLLPAGDMPRGYGAVYCLGAPGTLLAPDCAALEGGPAAAWTREGADVGALRALYVAVRALLGRPYAGRSALALCRALAQETGLSACAVHAGLMALGELALVDYAAEPFSLSMRPMARVRLEDSKVFRAMFELKAWGGAGS